MRYIFIVLFCVYSLYANTAKGDIEFAKKNYIKAIEYYKQSLSDSSQKNIDIKLAQSYVRLADNLKKTKDYTRSLYYYNEAKKLNSRIAPLRMAKIYELQGDLHHKIKEYEKALVLYTKSYKYNKDVKSKIKKVKSILSHQEKLKNDTRVPVVSTSPVWTKAIGRLIIPTKLEFVTKKRYKTNYKKCSATLINMYGYKKSKIIVTASHCLSQYDKNAGEIRFIIKDKQNNMLQKYAKVINDSLYDNKKIKTNSDYAVLALDSFIDQKEVNPLLITKKSFFDLQKDYKTVFGSLGGFSSDVGNFGSILTYDPKCKLKTYNEVYATSNCTGFKGASGGPVVINLSDDGKNFKYRFVGVVSHFKNGKFQQIYFSPHHIFYKVLKSAIKKYNN